MSRRSHYRSSKPARSGQHGAATTAHGGQAFASNGQPTAVPRPQAPVHAPVAPPPVVAAPPPGDAAGHGASRPVEPVPASGNGHVASNGHATGHPVAPPTNGHGDPSAGGSAGCTAPQLRRFIKSRSWVPMHELRRRFAINGNEDDVTPVAVDGSTIFVGLPTREGRLLGELFHAGDIGYELSMDPCTPIVIGVYPMRPVPRH